MASEKISGMVTFEYNEATSADTTRAGILEAAQEDWRAFIGDPEAELPWNTSVKTEIREGTATTLVTIRWERAT
jgi:hypothetical protein